MRYLAALLLLAQAAPCPAADVQPVQFACDVHAGPCTAVFGGGTLTLDVSPKPVTAMQELTFRLVLPAAGFTEQPVIDLGMPGMNMGPNPVRMEPAGDGAFTGSGVIVRCPSGKRTWFARISGPGMDPVEFVFDVVY